MNKRELDELQDMIRENRRHRYPDGSEHDRVSHSRHFLIRAAEADDNRPRRTPRNQIDHRERYRQYRQHREREVHHRRRRSPHFSHSRSRTPSATAPTETATLSSVDVSGAEKLLRSEYKRPRRDPDSASTAQPEAMLKNRDESGVGPASENETGLAAEPKATSRHQAHHDLTCYTAEFLRLRKHCASLRTPSSRDESRSADGSQRQLLVSRDELLNSDYILECRKYFDGLTRDQLKTITIDRIFSINNAPSLQLVLAQADETLSYLKFHYHHSLPINPADPYIVTVGTLRHAMFNKLNMGNLACLLGNSEPGEPEYQMFRQLANKPVAGKHYHESSYEVQRKPVVFFKSELQRALALVVAFARAAAVIRRRADRVCPYNAPQFLDNLDDNGAIDAYEPGAVTELVLNALRTHECSNAVCKTKVVRLLQPYKLALLFCPFDDEVRRGPLPDLTVIDETRQTARVSPKDPRLILGSSQAAQRHQRQQQQQQQASPTTQQQPPRAAENEENITRSSPPHTHSSSPQPSQGQSFVPDTFAHRSASDLEESPRHQTLLPPSPGTGCCSSTALGLGIGQSFTLGNVPPNSSDSDRAPGVSSRISAPSSAVAAAATAAYDAELMRRSSLELAAASSATTDEIEQARIASLAAVAQLDSHVQRALEVARGLFPLRPTPIWLPKTPSQPTLGVSSHYLSPASAFYPPEPAHPHHVYAFSGFPPGFQTNAPDSSLSGPTGTSTPLAPSALATPNQPQAPTAPLQQSGSWLSLPYYSGRCGATLDSTSVPMDPQPGPYVTGALENPAPGMSGTIGFPPRDADPSIAPEMMECEHHLSVPGY